MKLVDARGQLCPKPLIMVKKTLDSLNIGDEATILIDNETSKENVIRYLNDNKIFFSVKKEHGIFSIQFSKKELSILNEPLQYCTPAGQNILASFGSDIMGRGDDKLGSILIQSFINSLTEFPNITTLVFYNRGVLLATNESNVFNTLHELQNRGVQILICGTCADYFEVKNKITIGTISNMYSILEKLTSAEKIITP